MNFEEDGGGSDMDPSAAAQYAQGAGDAADADGLSGGMDSGGGGFPGAGGDGPMGRLFDGDAPGPSTTELENEYGLPRWGSVLGRGILRTATGSGVPPIAEIVLGGLMGVAKSQGDDAADTVDAVEGEQIQDRQGQPADAGGDGL